MDVRNRMADVIKLRCNACQDFIKMMLVEGWQQVLYDKAHDAVKNNRKFKSKYMRAYDEMRNFGIESYQVEKMDVTLIAEIVMCNYYNKFNAMKSVTEETWNALDQLRKDRNFIDHSNENIEPGELYLYGLLALCNLSRFVKTVDECEAKIPDNERLAFRQKYIAKISELQDVLDEERIENIEWKKKIDKDIRKVLESSNPLQSWCDVFALYIDLYMKHDHNPERYDYFIIRSAEMGIIYAFMEAANAYSVQKNYNEAERLMIMAYNAHTASAHDLVHSINILLSAGGALTPNLQKMIDDLQTNGEQIKQDADGLFHLETKRQRIKESNSNQSDALKKPEIKTKVSTVQTTYFKRCAQGHSSLVAALKSIGVDSSVKYRARIAAANGIIGYTDSVLQNLILLLKLRKGVLIKPIDKKK